jgi:hypothetical protein
VLIEYLQRYGDLKALRVVGPFRWFAEWYDDRQADAAQKELAARDFAVGFPTPTCHLIEAPTLNTILHSYIPFES